jgi:hypothetical protein
VGLTGQTVAGRGSGVASGKVKFNGLNAEDAEVAEGRGGKTLYSPLFIFTTKDTEGPEESQGQKFEPSAAKAGHLAR